MILAGIERRMKNKNVNTLQTQVAGRTIHDQFFASTVCAAPARS